jgi:hypothetical protein
MALRASSSQVISSLVKLLDAASARMDDGCHI